jgi:hypothetical protein
MLASNANRRAGDAAARDTSDLDGSIVPNSQTEFFPQAVRAELIGSNTCRAEGLTLPTRRYWRCVGG